MVGLSETDFRIKNDISKKMWNDFVAQYEDKEAVKECLEYTKAFNRKRMKESDAKKKKLPVPEITLPPKPAKFNKVMSDYAKFKKNYNPMRDKLSAIFFELVKFADLLDKRGMKKEADTVDYIVKLAIDDSISYKDVQNDIDVLIQELSDAKTEMEKAKNICKDNPEDALSLVLELKTMFETEKFKDALFDAQASLVHYINKENEKE
jgi:hypothetical protein